MVSIIGILSAILISFSIQPLLFKFLIGSKTSRPVRFHLLIHSIISFTYYGLGGFLLGLLSVILIPLIPVSKKIKMSWFHKILSKFMKSVFTSYPFLTVKVIKNDKDIFKKQAVIVANHTSFLDILAIGMLQSKNNFLGKRLGLQLTYFW